MSVSDRIIPVITDIGKQAVFEADNAQLKVNIKYIAIGTGRYTPTADRALLEDEKLRVEILSSQVDKENYQFTLNTIFDDKTEEFYINEIGFFLEDGTLFAVWSSPDKTLAYKSIWSKPIFSYTLKVVDVNLDAINIIDQGLDLQLNYEAEFANVNSEIEETKVDISELQEWREKMRIIFSANHFVWNGVQEVKLHTILKADRVEVNEGSAYDSNTGIFTAPIDGFYNFSSKVFVNTLVKNEDGSSIDYTDMKWHEDMIFAINRYDQDVTPDGSGAGADKIGEMWLGQVGSVGPDNLQAKWRRDQASDSVNHYLKAGEKVCVEFLVWNNATDSDGVMVSFSFSGHRIA
jgi:hypothetical protein